MMRAITSVVLIVSFVAGIAVPVSVLASEPEHIIDMQVALKTATNELHRRGLVLPLGYTTEVVRSTYEPEAGSTSPLFSVTFFGGRVGHRFHLYLVTIDRRNGGVDYVSNHLTSVEATSLSTSLSTRALRAATAEIRRRQRLLPDDYKTKVSPSVIYRERGADTSVAFVTFLSGGGKTAKQLYQVAVNRNTMKIEFVFDFIARTMD